ncbi:MAG: OmcA/MtrC family decaheme c-type cytochrome [Acidobacteria bacterium]|nr:OmcA/MtrC family decaheme c-type cytochrome [Acidobacteriota bacterium]
MQVRKAFYALALLFLAGISIMIAGDGVQPKYLASDKEFYLTEAEMAFIQPGLNLKIQKVEVSGSNVTVTFRISDNTDQPLDRLGVDTPGTVSTSWVLSRIKPGDTQYTSYITRSVTALPAPGCANCTVGNSVTQPVTDTGGTYTPLGSGTYTYKFGFQLPTGYEADSTTTVGVYATRDLRAIAEQLGLFKLVKTGRYISNATFNLVPSGKAVTVVRDVVRTEACNQCHNPLGLHGGARQITQLCILCHQPQNSDPETGNTVDFKVMIHKIHMGANLPSVTGRVLNRLGTSGSGTGTTFTGSTQGPIEEGTPIAGKPYQIIGFNQSVHDFSTVVWPQDVRNCTTCHQQGTQSDNWKNNPNRAACGSCHDNINFATGENHPGGVQLDDTKCTICHAADSGVEFDTSIAGAHTIPGDSKQLAGLKLVMTGVTNTNPGDKPTVSFTVADGKGNPVDATKLTSLSFAMAGPTGDYTWVTRGAPATGNPTGSPTSENALPTVKATSTGFTYTFSTALPADAKGTYSVGAFANRLITLQGSLLGQTVRTQEYIGINPVFYFGVGGAKTTPRRKVVDVANCNVCHKKLALHGGPRRNATELCQMCHNPANTDQPDQSRAAGFNVPMGTPPQSINFRFMIHRIHKGEELERDFTIYRSFGVFGYNGLLFPGDLRDCAKCHVNNSNQLPLPSTLAKTTAPREFFTPLGPAASACLGCHDGEDAAAHAFLMTAPFGESCAVCHGEGADFAVSRVHAR